MPFWRRLSDFFIILAESIWALPKRFCFSYEYEAGKKKYKETTELTLINGASSTRPESDDAIKYALQDIAERLI